MDPWNVYMYVCMYQLKEVWETIKSFRIPPTEIKIPGFPKYEEIPH
jgi:hypothetical protein